ncbi:MAG: glutathione S-transferase family protein [Burkholderiaceae bacterium]
MALTLYTHPQSRGRIARWMLEECGASYDTVVLHYGTTMKAPDYLALNPMGKVPALKHGDAIVTEAAAICAYLADVFPEKQLAPPVGSAARGSYYRWLFFAAGPVEAAATGKSLGLLAPRDKAAQAGYGAYEDVKNTLEHAVSQGPYLCGEHFTAADLYLGAHLNWGMLFGDIEKRPAFERYAHPIVQRPACLRANAIDDALAAQMAPP